MPASPKILYLVHDLSDPAVRRRVIMLRDGGALVTVAGFRRTSGPVSDVAGAPTLDLGQTYNGGFIQRIWSVLREVAGLKKHRDMFEKADVVIARNLEMLAIAVRGRGFAAKPPALVYESLDIHRLLLNQGPVGTIFRTLEGWLASRASVLITSSPAFVREYFERLSQVRLPVRLIENKVYGSDITIPEGPRRPGPPWKIGWFGAIRCRKSLRILSDLVRQSDGAIEVIIRGRPAYDQLPDFDKITSETPGLIFAGPYKNPDDLPSIYREVHFSWAIDMFEEGLNSSWLLPNRLYEGGLFNTVPIALKSVETGRFLDGLKIGVTLADPLDLSLRSFFRNLTAASYSDLELRATKVPSAHWYSSKKDCEHLVEFLKDHKT
jgi:hypothetical protein